MTESTSIYAAPALSGTPLSPFGVVVQAPSQGADLRQVPPAALAALTEQAGVVVLRGYPLLATADLVVYCETWGEILTWDFGPVLDLVIQDDPQNYLFTRGRVPYHFDGAFARAVPRFFMFQCLQAPGENAGGQTVFCDTTQAWQAATTEQRARWRDVRITYRTDKVVHYGGKATWPLVASHPTTGAPVLRYAEPLDPQEFKNPLFLDVDGLAETAQDQLVGELAELLYRPELNYAHTWRDGDILIADNHALLHGRRAFIGNASRTLQRIQIL